MLPLCCQSRYKSPPWMPKALAQTPMLPLLMTVTLSHHTIKMMPISRYITLVLCYHDIFMRWRPDSLCYHAVSLFFLHPHHPIFMQVINHWITLFFVCRYLFYHLLLFNFHLYSSTCIPSYTLRHFSYICRNKWNHVFLFYSCMEQALRLPKRSRLLFHRESDCDPILVQARCPVDNNRWYPCLVRGSTSSNHNNYLFIPGPRYKSNSQAQFSCWM